MFGDRLMQIVITSVYLISMCVRCLCIYLYIHLSINKTFSRGLRKCMDKFPCKYTFTEAIRIFFVDNNWYHARRYGRYLLQVQNVLPTKIDAKSNFRSSFVIVLTISLRNLIYYTIETVWISSTCTHKYSLSKILLDFEELV